MTVRRPLVHAGSIRELQDGDRLLGVREQLTAPRTYYVRTDGNDSNTGLANSASGAFLTLQRALNEAGSIDLAVYDLTIQIAAGTYAGAPVAGATVGAGRVLITGNVANPASVALTSTLNALQFNGRGRFRVSGLSLSSTGGSVIISASGADVEVGNLVFGTAGTFGAHLYCDTGSLITVIAGYSITGGAWYHARAVTGGIIRSESSITVTLTGTPAFTGAFVQTFGLSQLFYYSATFSGAATGVRYNSTAGGLIFSNAAGENYYPGNSPGTKATGGQYL